MRVLMLGSAPMAAEAARWPREPFDLVLAINNAWRIRSDWDVAIHPYDFPAERQAVAGPGQRIVTEAEFVPAQNEYGGFVYAGATMAFTAAYWALHALKPEVIAVFGCDMQYPASGPTHFYGSGTPDPLRQDVTLRCLEAKAARLMLLAARQGCAMVNLSTGPARLVFPRLNRARLPDARPMQGDEPIVEAALRREAELGYLVASGRYWEEEERFDVAELDRLDALWLQAAAVPLRRTA
ncbi:hypothetical protein [Tabrizicola flagellatus]|uniref:hypothetical protein n=1 Tax=Tabrizicola flagellatus TaxID=2593021 RepID=UPI0011F34D5F|nr:hypothetical protein [Tabrizicola flagellatus]